MTPTKTTHKLSPAQRDMLANAVAWRGGMVLYSKTVSMTILKNAGYIEEVLDIRESTERAKVMGERDGFIQDAKELLAANNWKAAHKALEHAQRRQHALDHKVWWITEAGRAALEATA